MEVLHVLIIKIIKSYDIVFIPKEYTAILEHNQRYIRIVQKKDADKAIAKQSGDLVLS